MQPEEPRRATIMVITLGGTIGALLGAKVITNDAAAQNALIAQIRSAEAEQDVSITIMNALNVPSPNLEPEDWTQFSQIISTAHHNGIDRFLITHGTDTLHYTAAFLAMQFAGWPLRICVTGAFFPINHPRSDGAANLGCALRAVSDQSLSNQVYVCFEDRLGVAKALTLMPPDFDETGYRVLYNQAQTSQEITEKLSHDILYAKIPLVEANQMKRAKRNVSFARLYPGIDMRLFDGASENAFIILEGFHSGTASGGGEIENILALRTKRPDLTICLGSIPSPMVGTPYQVSVALAEGGIRVYRDIPPHVLFVGALLGKARNLSEEDTFARFSGWKIVV